MGNTEGKEDDDDAADEEPEPESRARPGEISETLWRSTLEGVEVSPRRGSGLGDARTTLLSNAVAARALLDRLAANPLHLATLRATLGARPGEEVLSLRSDAEVLDELARQLDRGTLRAEFTRSAVSLPRLPIKPPEKPKEEPPAREVYEVEFEITDHFGNPMADARYVLFFPNGNTKEGRLDREGRVKESPVPPGTYRLELKLVSNARWGADKAVVDEPIKLFAATGGFAEGTAGKFEIYDYRGLSGDKLASVDGTIASKGTLSAEWTPTKDSVKDLIGGKVVFLAVVSDSTALSPRVPLLIKHEFELKDDNGALADTTMKARFVSGYETTVDVVGGKAAIWARVGDRLSWIDLPGHAGAYMKLVEEGGATRELYLPEGAPGGMIDGDV